MDHSGGSPDRSDASTVALCTAETRERRSPPDIPRTRTAKSVHRRRGNFPIYTAPPQRPYSDYKVSGETSVGYGEEWVSEGDPTSAADVPSKCIRDPHHPSHSAIRGPSNRVIAHRPSQAVSRRPKECHGIDAASNAFHRNSCSPPQLLALERGLEGSCAFSIANRQARRDRAIGGRTCPPP